MAVLCLLLHDRRHPTKKACGSIGNTTVHLLPGLQLFAISIALSMLSACNATLNLAALLLTSIEIFIIIFLLSYRSSKKKCTARGGASASATWLVLVCYVAYIFGVNTELTSESPF